ncbi:MAG: DUF4340 domain-containing protein [Candidatus Zixiibacteriota bacterium]
MDENKSTMIFGGAALGLALMAFLLSGPSVTPDAFLDQGEEFFPKFTDPNSATTLEVIEFNEETGRAKPFKVTNQNGVWTIPSHHDHPADGKERLAKTAAGVIGITKDDFRTDNVADHVGCGVIDPLDESALSLEGRGQRVTLKGNGGATLADFIVGKEVSGRAGFRFVRIPGEKRVYAVRMDLDISTSFVDWIDDDMLEVDKDRIGQVILHDYSVDERTGSVNVRDRVKLGKNEATWSADNMPKGYVVDSVKMQQLLTALDELKIVGVRPKPEGISAALKRFDSTRKVSAAQLLSLQKKGYFLTRTGELKSNEGELELTTDDALRYTLRFGEVVYGTGEDVSAGTKASDDKTASAGENRYVFLSTRAAKENFPEPKKPGNTDFENKADSLLSDADKKNRELAQLHRTWELQIERAEKLAKELNDRYAKWYYVISAESFDKLNLKRSDLVVVKPAEKS